MTKRVRVCSMIAAVAVSTALAFADDAAKTPIEAARQSIADLEWATAIKLYTPIRDSAAPASAEWSEATFCLATAYHQVQPPDSGTIGQADSLYKQLAEQSKDERYVARGLLGRGRILELQDYGGDKIDLDGARKFYEEVMTKYEGKPIAAEAALRAGASLVMAFDTPDFVKVRQGVDLIEKWVTAHPSDPMANIMWQYLGDSYFKPLGDYKNSLRCYEMVDKLGWADQGNQGVWYWRAAVMSEQKLKDYPSAIKYYTKIIKETPNSGKAYEALIALKRLGAPLPKAPLLEDQNTRAESVSAAPATQPEAQR